MTRKPWLRASCAFFTSAALIAPSVACAATPETRIAPKSSAYVASNIVPESAEPRLSRTQKLALLRQKIKYVFVLFQENRSFDQYFGTYPGANGLFYPNGTPTFAKQPIVTVVNNQNTISAISTFKVPNSVTVTGTNTQVPIYPADLDSVDHSHAGVVNDIDYANGVTKNDRYALNEEGLTTDASGNIVSRSTGAPLSSLPTLTEFQVQRGELVMSHLDCDAAPFLWQYADRFAMFDNFHMTINGPSAPNAVSLIAGQTGLTEWAKHPSLSNAGVIGTSLASTGGVPLVNDQGPFAGSNFDTSPIKPPYGPNDVPASAPTLNQTYASLPLSFMGSNINKIIKHDQNPALDLLDVQSDIATVASKDAPVHWGWYQEGYGLEPTDVTGVATHATYITHHNGPQYFGYVGDNPVEQQHLHALGNFIQDVTNQALPAKGGVFYVRGGYGNNDGLIPVDPSANVQRAFVGSDDHPGYSDGQIAESLLADSINAIAASPYWAHSAIIITYDETDGYFDHVPESIRVNDPFGNPLSGGPRIPAIVISPFAKVHAISSKYAEHSSVIKFIDELFNLVPLQRLPDEANAEAIATNTIQPNMGPIDADPSISDLTEVFDNARLSGTAAPLPPAFAEIPRNAVLSLPHYGGQGCEFLQIVPTDYVNGGIVDPAPIDFNPRPGTSPGIPTSGTWTP